MAENYDLAGYLTKCVKAQIKVVFTTLINVKKSDQQVFQRFLSLTKIANKLGMDVYGDVDGTVYEEFGLDKNNREQIMDFFIIELGLKGIRFDCGVSPEDMAKLTHNHQDIKIILNASNPAEEVAYLLSLQAKKSNLVSCWNFYPQRYTASSLSYFTEKITALKASGILSQAFVALQRSDAQGPWQHNDKLPSIEMHRDLSLDFQVRHFVALGVDDIIVSTQFLNDTELMVLTNINLHKITLNLKPAVDITSVEQKILNDQSVHFVRPDLAEYIIRSTFSRLKYHHNDIPVRHFKGKYFEKGDVVILNNNAQNYKGELQIVTKQMANDGIRNLVGHLEESEQSIVACLTPNCEFSFNLAKES
ncbi:MupG family TIM beta-alpha barrel fold protein [Spiroplasma endosymbiont of Stenodema calcarata]|uniref:MupG family TIM beta-alpha barrel fold protein n=1 Tax=Spiroplasma endosymbiont of Stenodema calcarata TaxID=3139328 RepID=UPI003CCA6EF6